MQRNENDTGSDRRSWLSGQNLVNSVKSSGTIRFTTAHIRNEATVTGFCAEPGLFWTGSLDTMLADKKIDVVVFATPHIQHPDQVIRAANAGKHIFVEKPSSLSVANAIRAEQAAKQASIVLGSDSTADSIHRWAGCETL